MVNFSSINAIIFDLGGVLFDINYQNTADAFAKLGMNNFVSAYSQAQQNQLFDEFEKGNVSNEIFRNFIRENISHQLLDEEIDAAWCAMLIGMEPIKFETLKKVGAHFPIFLLSNTNAIHLPKVHEMIAQKTPENSLEKSFLHCYFSNQIHLRKPDAAAFEIILQENNLQPENTLFLDDSIQHIVGAQKIRLQAIHITSEMNTEKIFAPFL